MNRVECLHIAIQDSQVLAKSCRIKRRRDWTGVMLLPFDRPPDLEYIWVFELSSKEGRSRFAVSIVARTKKRHLTIFPYVPELVDAGVLFADTKMSSVEYSDIPSLVRKLEIAVKILPTVQRFFARQNVQDEERCLRSSKRKSCC